MKRPSFLISPLITKGQVEAFFRTGLLVISASLLLTLGLRTVPDLIPASTASVKELPIYCVETDKPQIALTFDTAWGNDDTEALLNALATSDIKATFFLTGEWIRKYPEEVKAIAAAGHDLGNNSESHAQMTKLTAEQCKEELQKPFDRVHELTGVKMNLFRPPYGSFNDTVIRTAKELGYQSIQWNIDSMDWKDYGSDSILETILDHDQLTGGSIILLHSGSKYLMDALPLVIQGLRDKGYELVPVSKLIEPGEDEIKPAP